MEAHVYLSVMFKHYCIDVILFQIMVYVKDQIDKHIHSTRETAQKPAGSPRLHRGDVQDNEPFAFTTGA